jgi:hypothetical protein
MIDKILRKIGFKATTHEPCLYKGVIDGNFMLFLRQVDDFAIATCSEDTANKIIARVNENLRLPIHNMGIIT